MLTKAQIKDLPKGFTPVQSTSRRRCKPLAFNGSKFIPRKGGYSINQNQRFNPFKPF